jgi:hypothetical protein
MVLADFLDEPAYGPLPHEITAPHEDTPAIDLAAWIPTLVDRAPPPSPAALLPTLARRVGDVVERLNAKGAGLTAHGVLGHAAGRTVTLDRRGTSRVYLARDGVARLLIPEHSLAQASRAQGTDPPRELDGVMLSWFDAALAPVPTTEPPVEIALAAGDRLLLVPHLVYDQCDDERLLRGVLAPDVLVSELAGRCPRGWGLTVITAKG